MSRGNVCFIGQHTTSKEHKKLRSPHTTLQEHWIRDFLSGSSHLEPNSRPLSLMDKSLLISIKSHQVSDTLRLEFLSSWKNIPNAVSHVSQVESILLHHSRKMVLIAQANSLSLHGNTSAQLPDLTSEGFQTADFIGARTSSVER